jgi:hypothetical protein
MRVLKRSTGTDHPVVAMKGGNAPGAKGLDHLALPFGQPEMGGAKAGKAKLVDLKPTVRMIRAG